MALTLNLIAVFAFGILVQDSFGCPNAWITFNGMCYNFVTTKMNWFHASHACKAQDAWLVDIKSSAEEEFLKATIHRLHAHEDPQNIGYWSGGNDIDVEGKWVWGYPSEDAISYTDWYHGEPNNHWYDGRKEACIVLWGHSHHGFQWNDQPCELTDYFICETEDSSGSIIG